jgi:hypothetical protein
VALSAVLIPISTTCYKETLSYVNETAPEGTTLFVLRQPSIAQEYAAPGITVSRFEPRADKTIPGSLLLLTTRTDVDLTYHPEAPSGTRSGGRCCLLYVKQLP